MKTFTKSLSGLLSASTLAIGLAVMAPSASAGISGSAHDLSATFVGGATQICVYCHTPHGANTAVDAPLWNKGVTSPDGLTATDYTLYTSATMDGTASAGSVSLACLSCHDGVQARDNMINAPGSGGFTPFDAITGIGGSAGTVGDNIGSGIVNLGTDLSNDHPIGMRYCAAADAGGALSGGTSCGDDSFNASVAGSVLTRLFVDVNSDATYQKTDLPLYGGSAGARDANVECATCHDPHNTDNGTFLRVSNDTVASALCLTCHNK